MLVLTHVEAPVRNGRAEQARFLKTVKVHVWMAEFSMDQTVGLALEKLRDLDRYRLGQEPVS